jgi:hypothetical protein
MFPIIVCPIVEWSGPNLGAPLVGSSAMGDHVIATLGGRGCSWFLEQRGGGRGDVPGVNPGAGQQFGGRA